MITTETNSQEGKTSHETTGNPNPGITRLQRDTYMVWQIYQQKIIVENEENDNIIPTRLSSPIFTHH
jgi:hypothetical protein